MPDSDISLDALLELDDLCDEYESQLRQGLTPPIDQLAQRAPVEHRGKLLCELAKLEVGLLSDTGKNISTKEILDRYLLLLPEGEGREALRSTVERAVAAAETAQVQRPDHLAATVTQVRSTVDLAATTDLGPTAELPLHEEETPLPEIDGFEILSVLGRGGMGVVYKAVQTALNRPVALKMILDRTSAQRADLDRFVREAQAVAELNDPRFVQIYEFGQADGKPYMALEYVEGGSLEQHRQGQPQPAEFSAKTIENLASAMHQAHARGLVHRDLKPHNVLLTADLQPKIADFGLVKRLDQDHTQTQQGTVMGTASYMAPEQSRGDADVGPAADIHALGCILYCLLTGRPPFLGATVHDTILQVRQQDPVPPSRLAPEVPKDLETICLKCLEKEPEKRYATAQDLAEDLENYQAGRPIIARPVSAVERSWRWAKRNRWIAGLGATSAAALLAVAVVSSVMSWRLSVSNDELGQKRDELSKSNTDLNAQKQALALSNEQLKRKTQEEKDAREAKSTQYNSAMDTFRDALDRVDKRLRNDRRQLETRREVMKIVIDGLEKIRDPSEDTTLADRNDAIGLERMGEIYQTAGELKTALEQYDKALAILSALSRKNPNEPIHQSNRAAIHMQRAEANVLLGNTLEARKDYQEALKYRIRWVELTADIPNHYGAERAMAKTFFQLGRLDLALGAPERALENFNQCREWYLKIPIELLKKETELVRELADLEQRFGEANYYSGRIKEADRRFRRALKKRLQLQREHEGPERDVALSQRALGDFWLMADRDPARAWVAYKDVLSYFRKAYEKQPDLRITKFDLAVIEYRIGALLLLAEKKGVALKGIPADDTAMAHFQRSCELREKIAEIDPDDIQAKLEWALALARSGRHDEAETQGNFVAEKAKGDPRLLFQSACIFALASETKDQALKAKRNDNAFELLDKLIQAGWQDRISLRQDPDLDPLRSDPRFEKCLQVLEANR